MEKNIEFIAQLLYDLLMDREWDRDDYAGHCENYCKSCGALARGAKIPDHKVNCKFVEAIELFNEWTVTDGLQGR